MAFTLKEISYFICLSHTVTVVIFERDWRTAPLLGTIWYSKETNKTAFGGLFKSSLSEVLVKHEYLSSHLFHKPKPVKLQWRCSFKAHTVTNIVLHFDYYLAIFL